ATALSAQAQTDAATGFGLRPVPGYQARLAVRDNDEIRYDVNAVAGRPAPAGSPELCRVRFTAETKNAGMTRKALDAMANPDSPRAVNLRRGLGVVADPLAPKAIRMGRARGLELTGPARDDGGMLFFSAADVPTGRVTILCIVASADYPAALPQLRALRAAIKLPR
ncbi:MAG: hypothetical protein ACRCUX_05740, partial [Beijerinckiaceae bacterium]